MPDPEGGELRLWRARARLGAQAVAEPGHRNLGDLLGADPAAAAARYADASGWRGADQGRARAIQVSGFGDHLAATVDHDIRTREAHAPEGLTDVVGSIRSLGRQHRWPRPLVRRGHPRRP